MAGNSAGRGDRSYQPAQLSSILSPATKYVRLSPSGLAPDF